MTSYGESYCFEGVSRGFELRTARGISAYSAALAVVLAFALAPAETRAQDDRDRPPVVPPTVLVQGPPEAWGEGR